MTKTRNQIIFFSSTKIRILFSATLGIRIFFFKKTITPLQVKWSVPYRKLSLNINKSFYSSSQVLAPNQHIQKHKFDWFDVTRQLLEYNPGTYQGLKMSSVEQPLT
jgi:hypothetical protein